MLHDISEEESPVIGWDTLLDRITDREARIGAGIDGNTVRRILERLATKARASQDGLGSLNAEALTQAFHGICGYEPDAGGMVLLQRLPGLGVALEEENRTFIDEDFADACRVGDLMAFVESPFVFPPSVLAEMEGSIGSLGLKIASYKVRKKGLSEGQINAALEQAHRRNSKHVAADIVRLLLEVGFDLQHQITLYGLLIPELELDIATTDLSKLEFQSCFFSRVEIDPAVDVDKMPLFRECYIDELEGRVSKDDLPSGKFDEACVIEHFSKTAETTAEVLTLHLPLGTRVCLTVLKKLYEQSGSGRKENALYRGLDDRARRLVPDVLHILQSEEIAISDKSRQNTIWRPNRNSRTRVGRMVTAPTTENDVVLDLCGKLQT